MPFRLHYAITGQIDSLGDSLKTLPVGSKSAALAGVAATVAAASFAAIAAGSVALVKLYDQEAAAQRKITGILGAQGGSARVTAAEVFSMAKSFQTFTTFSDDAILSVQGVLLASARLTKNQLAVATETAANLSLRLGTDIKSTALLLGKALSSQGEGLSALSRAGIEVTDAERDFVQGLFEAGRTDEGIETALSILSRGSDGIARQVAGGLGVFEILANQFTELGQQIGKIIAPEVVAIAELISKNIPAEGVFEVAFQVKTAITATLIAIAQTVIETFTYLQELGPNYGKILKGAITGNPEALREGLRGITASGEKFFSGFAQRFADNFDLAAQTVIETNSQFEITQQAIARAVSKTRGSIEDGSPIVDQNAAALKALQDEGARLTAEAGISGDLRRREIAAEYRNEELTRTIARNADELRDIEQNHMRDLERIQADAEFLNETEAIRQEIARQQSLTVDDLMLANQADYLERVNQIRQEPYKKSLSNQAAYWQNFGKLRGQASNAQEAATSSLAETLVGIDSSWAGASINILDSIAQLVENAKGGVGKEKTLGEKIVEIVLIKAKSLTARLNNLKTISDIYSAIIALICNILIHIEEAIAIHNVGIVHFAEGSAGSGGEFSGPIVATYSPGEIVVDEEGSRSLRDGGRLGQMPMAPKSVALSLTVPAGLGPYLTVRKAA